MPHLIIEFSRGQAAAPQVEALLDAAHRAAVASGLFEEGHIRVRASELEYFRVGGRADHFIHLQCRIHSGRDAGQRAQLSRALLAALQGQQWPAASITVEVVEMERATYAKYTSPNERE